MCRNKWVPGALFRGKMNHQRPNHAIVRFFKNVFLLGIYKHQADYEKARKLVIVNTISLYAIIVLLIVGGIGYYRGNTVLGLLDLSAALLLVFCIIRLRRSENHLPPIYIGISVMTGLYLYLFFSGGSGGTGFLWYYTYPLFTLYVMGKRDGSIASLILMLPSFIYLMLIWDDPYPIYSQDFTIRFIPSLLCVLIFSYLFETTRLKTQHQLKTKHNELESTIAQLRRKEAELNKTQDGLEAQVEVRTRELRQSNDDLKTEIEQRKRSVAQQKKLEAQLLQAKKMQAIGTLAGGVAHDLNNILSGITSYPELMLMQLPEQSSLRKPLETVQASGQKAVAIVQDLLTLSRREAAVFQTVDLNQVVCDYLKSPELKAMLSHHKGVTIDIVTDSAPNYISGSAVHLSKTIMNLVTNAAEAMPDGGRISIALNAVSVPIDSPEPEGLAPGIYVKLTVSDSGKGIAAEVIDRIYEPFFTTKKMGLSGTGLGMAVVWGTVEDHNGHINVRSHPQRGTIFELWFPAEFSGTADQSTVPVEVPEGDNETILVVDDIPEQREIAAAMLGKLNYQVRKVSSGEEAVNYLQERNVDLVLLDMTMDPGINGLETYRRILQFKPRQRVVIASGFSGTDLVHDVLQMGAQCYLKKPYSFEALSNAVRKALQQ